MDNNRDNAFMVYWQTSTTLGEQRLIMEFLSGEDTVVDTDPVIVFDFLGPSMDALFAYLRELTALPEFLGGSMPTDHAALETSIMNTIQAGRGILAGRILLGLTCADAFFVAGQAGVFWAGTLRPLLVMAGGTSRSLFEMRHLVSRNRQPPNDIQMTVATF